MKKSIKAFAIILSVMMLIPFITVNAASSKTEKIVSRLNASETLKAVKGTAKYEDGALSIEYSDLNTAFSSLEYPYEGTVISYTPDDVTNYEEAEAEASSAFYALQLVYSALLLNGYTEDQISEYFKSETNNPTFEVNGFELKSIGEEKEFTSKDGSSTLTTSLVSVKVDVSKANLNAPGDPAAEPKSTTVQNVVDNLAADESFTSYKWEDGTVVYENEISCQDDYIVIDHTDYNYEDHYISFECENDVLTYSAEEIANYDEANLVVEHTMWATVIMRYALEENGYSEKEISGYFSNENNSFDYDKNGIELKELGKAKTFENDTGSITVTPLSIKIDFAKANIEPVNDDQADAEFAMSNADGALLKSPVSGDIPVVYAALFMLLAACALTAIIKLKKNAE